MSGGFVPCRLRNLEAVDEAKIPVAGSVEVLQDFILQEVHQGRRLAGYFGRSLPGGAVKLYALLADDREGRLHAGAVEVAGKVPSITPRCPQAHLFEREIHEQFDCEPEGHPWLKPVRYPRAASSDADPIPGDTPFFSMRGDEVHEVAVGPVHAGIIEPGHFRFQCHGERVFHLEIQLGYQHRGVEDLLVSVPAARIPFVAESIAGDTAVGHGLAWAMAWETLAGSRVSARAESLRAIALELERLANHAGDLGALGNDIGFVPTSAYFGRLRGEFLNLLVELTGNRYGRGFVRPGGVTMDLTPSMAESFAGRLRRAWSELRRVADLFFETPSVMARLENVGTVSTQSCQDLGLVGMAARACGIDRDVRKDHPHGIYRFHLVPTVTAEGGDVHARALVRWLEIERSLEFVISQMQQLPGGTLRAPCGAPAPGRFVASLVEGWRGEILHVAITDKKGGLARYKVVDPSFRNWTGLSLAMRNQQISDFPLINKSFNLSYAGHDL